MEKTSNYLIVLILVALATLFFMLVETRIGVLVYLVCVWIWLKLSTWATARYYRTFEEKLQVYSMDMEEAEKGYFTWNTCSFYESPFDDEQELMIISELERIRVAFAEISNWLNQGPDHIIYNQMGKFQTLIGIVNNTMVFVVSLDESHEYEFLKHVLLTIGKGVDIQ